MRGHLQEQKLLWASCIPKSPPQWVAVHESRNPGAHCSASGSSPVWKPWSSLLSFRQLTSLEAVSFSRSALPSHPGMLGRDAESALRLCLECSLLCLGGAAHAGLGLHHQSLVRKMLYILTLWRHFLNQGSLPSDDSSSRRVDRNN